MSKKEHESGTDRIAEAVAMMPALTGMGGDVIINVQGDEPFVQKEALQKLCELFTDADVRVASLMHIITEPEMISDPNCVKVVVKKNRDAMYFSRSTIPFQRDKNVQQVYYKHIGIYGYRKEALLKFTQLPASLLEQAEKLEQLRLLENEINIRMAVTEPWGISIDTKQDLEKAKTMLK